MTFDRGEVGPWEKNFPDRATPAFPGIFLTIRGEMA